MHKGKYLKYLISHKGFSQLSIAETLDYSTSKVSRIMNDSNPDNSIIFDILGLLNISKEEFEAGLKLFNPGGVTKSGHQELVEFKLKYVTEKEQWLNEKADLLAKQEELQEAVGSLRDKLRDKEK